MIISDKQRKTISVVDCECMTINVVDCRKTTVNIVDAQGVSIQLVDGKDITINAGEEVIWDGEKKEADKQGEENQRGSKT